MDAYVVYKEFGYDLELLGVCTGKTALDIAKRFAYLNVIEELNDYDDEYDDEQAGLVESKDGLTYTIEVGDTIVERFVIEKTMHIRKAGG